MPGTHTATATAAAAAAGTRIAAASTTIPTTIPTTISATTVTATSDAHCFSKQGCGHSKPFYVPGWTDLVSTKVRILETFLMWD